MRLIRKAFVENFIDQKVLLVAKQTLFYLNLIAIFFQLATFSMFKLIYIPHMDCQLRLFKSCLLNVTSFASFDMRFMHKCW